MRESSTQSMMNWGYLPLALAAKKLGCTENVLIHTCNEKNLKLFIDQTNLIFVGNDGAEIDINIPVYIDDQAYLDKLIKGEESIMLFSEQYPNGFLWDLGALEIAMFGDGNYKLSNEQKEKLINEGSLSVHRDEVATGLGVVLSHNKLLISQRDLDKLVARQTAMKEQDYTDARRELESEKQVKSAQLQTKTVIDDDAKSSEREYTKWLREIWSKEGYLTGAPFFKALKDYKNKKDSLVIDWWWTSPKGPGVKIRTNTGEIELPMSQIQKIASRFKKDIKLRNLSIDN